MTSEKKNYRSKHEAVHHNADDVNHDHAAQADTRERFNSESKTPRQSENYKLDRLKTGISADSLKRRIASATPAMTRMK